MVLVQMPRKDSWLVAHAASLPKALHLLQRDDVATSYRTGDSFNVDTPVLPHPETHVVGHDVHKLKDIVDPDFISYGGHCYRKPS